MLRLNDGVPELAGPCGPEPWYLEVGPDEDPVEVVSRLSANLLGPPLLAHSTSWRRARGGVILSFIVVIADGQAPDFEGVPIGRAALARNSATEAARSNTRTSPPRRSSSMGLGICPGWPKRTRS